MLIPVAHLTGAFLASFFSLSVALMAYRATREMSFDPFWLLSNFKDVSEVLLGASKQVEGMLGGLLVLGVWASFGFANFFKHLPRLLPHVRALPSLLLFLLGAGATFMLYAFYPNEVKLLAAQLTRGEGVVAREYSRLFQFSLESNSANKFPPTLTTQKPGNHVFFFQWESLNGTLVSEVVTPHLLSIARRDGVLFPLIQGSSVQTIRAQESVLCGIAPSLRNPLASYEQLPNELECLPKILRRQGYRTLFFHSYFNLNFSHTGRFMRAIGFDEVHSSDIMQKGDPQLTWGYRDDIFYQRVFEYLERFKDERLFVYIAVSGTNHFPFFYDATLFPSSRVPHSSPRDFRKRLENLTFLQDSFFGEAYTAWYVPRYGAKSYAFVFGDHSWPAGNRNIYNEIGYSQENFLTALAVIPPRDVTNNFYRGAVVPRWYSPLDYLPSLLDLLGIRGYRHLGTSFSSELFTYKKIDEVSSRCLVSVQPYGGGFVSVLQFPQKFVFDTQNDTVSSFLLTARGEVLQSRKKVEEIDLCRLRSCGGISCSFTEGQR
jgi:hypothetical protein